MGSKTPSSGEIEEFRHRLIDFTGHGFVFGAAGGSFSHLVRGLHSSPSGARLAGGVHAVRTNGLRLAGRWGAFMALYCSLERAVSLARLREDTWSPIAAGAAAAGLLGMHRGAAAATRSAFLGATLVVGFVGTNWTVDLLASRLLSGRRRARETLLGCDEQPERQ
ncbi:hypothetical protein PR202_ga20959 [Eleusine coracana subsp. coracana]|uniref:Uncharacterized protein n=1 Tax=Eleusine coracana subsp. coracana TaxID=191504 RepID=A0AAV5CYN5_ELECO|nr:hypothetical protein QOZ80_8AG0630500 [Eleusine coracana subsp. coracana]GJN03504.1 hypothetical protein PR202_ga20959 [Eleusine coracana subsp. coracana]